MGIKKTGLNKWCIKVSVRVKQGVEPVKKQETFKGTKTEAQLREADIIKQIRANKGSESSLTPQTIRTFKEAIELFKEKRGPFSAPHTRKIDFLSQELGHNELAAMPDRFEAYLRALKAVPAKGRGKRSNASLNRYTEIVRAVFGLLLDLEHIEKNPITKARFPKLEEKARDRYLNHEERLRLVNAIRKHRAYLLPIIQYMLLVPCRKSELTEACREQYNQFTGTILIPDSKADIPIYKPVPAEMVDYFNSIPSDCPYLFFYTDKDGNYKKLGSLQKPWAYCLKKAELQNVRIHDLRHISATDLYEAGNPERMIMDIAGWKTAMLSQYRHKDSFRSAQNIQFKKPEPKAGTLQKIASV